MPERRQSRAVIAHWYTPPYLVDLVDIVGGPGTDPAIVAKMRETITALGKVPVVLRRFIPGYIANRIQAAIGLEVNWLLDQGYASPREIDESIIHGLALRIPILGHLAKGDFTGLQLLQHALANRSYAPPPATGAERDPGPAGIGGAYRRAGRTRLFRLGRSRSRRFVPGARPQAARTEARDARGGDHARPMTDGPDLTDRASFENWATENVRYGDTDRQGHVNNAVFATYSESGRSAFLRSAALPAFPTGCWMVLVAITIEFRAEVFWPDQVDIGTTVLSVGRSSITIGQGMFTSGGCVATSRNTVVMVDQQTRRPTPLPAEYRQALAGMAHLR